MELIDNINKTLKEDLKKELAGGSKISIAAASFSMFAFSELKEELEKCDQLRFIFTEPAFYGIDGNIVSKEFYIPRMTREQNLYGTGFEIKLRNELNQKAIAFKTGTVKHIYFVAETKGSMDTLELRGIEDAKIHCAREHFKAISGDDVICDVVDSYQALLDKVMK